MHYAALVTLGALITSCDPTTMVDPDAPDDTGDADVTDDLLTASEPELPATLFDYRVAVPAAYQPVANRLDNTPQANPITDAGATLGRVLFYDRRLSANQSIACGSCHISDLGFADQEPLSLGFDGDFTGRKSMPLHNVRYYGPGRMFWDERAATLEDQVLLPIQDEAEMGMTLTEVITRLQAADFYGPLFEDAYGDPTITEEGIADALAQFVRAMAAFDSAWDEGIALHGAPNVPFDNYTPQENRGKQIFFGDGGPPLCNACHLPPPPPGVQGPNLGFFYMPGPRVNGLGDPDDVGVGEVSGDPRDNGRFKSPTLRNVAVRAPYMHDGRFETLREVVDFYDAQVRNVPNLDPALRTPDGQPRRLNLSDADKEALVAFLETLTDTSLANDERFSDPFPD